MNDIEYGDGFRPSLWSGELSTNEIFTTVGTGKVI